MAGWGTPVNIRRCSGESLTSGANKSGTGSWFGRWGVNYLYGTGAALPALEALGEDMTQPRVRCAVEWLRACQNDDDGWGESCASYVDHSLRGQGESTPSQTAWALVALIAAGEIEHESVRRGIAFLLDRQRDDGTWDEPQFTGCGFPGYGAGNPPDQYERTGAPRRQGREMGAAFMLKYHLYRNYFPLWALGRYARKAARNRWEQVQWAEATGNTLNGNGHEPRVAVPLRNLAVLNGKDQGRMNAIVNRVTVQSTTAPEFFDITEQVRAHVTDAGVQNGLVCVLFHAYDRRGDHQRERTAPPAGYGALPAARRSSGRLLRA